MNAGAAISCIKQYLVSCRLNKTQQSNNTLSNDAMPSRIALLHRLFHPPPLPQHHHHHHLRFRKTRPIQCQTHATLSRRPSCRQRQSPRLSDEANSPIVLVVVVQEGVVDVDKADGLLLGLAEGHAQTLISLDNEEEPK